jgi:hypothetical protein
MRGGGLKPFYFFSVGRFAWQQTGIMRSITNFQKGVSILGVDEVNTAGGCWIVQCREEIKVKELVKLFVMNVGEAARCGQQHSLLAGEL